MVYPLPVAKGEILLHETYALNSQYRVVLTVFKVSRSRKFPIGIKAKFVLLDVDGGFARLLVDNHEPFGFHMHTSLPDDANVRVELTVKDHHEALEIFLQEAERIIEYEKR